MQIMPKIYMIDIQTHPQFISSIIFSLSGVPRNSLKLQEGVKIQKQEKCTQEC